MKRTKKSTKSMEESTIQESQQELITVEAKTVEPLPKPISTTPIKSTEQDGVWVRLSSSLRKKLLEQAQEEGISFEEYVSELLAESVVLRAWEIAEKKAHMRGSAGPSNSQNNSHNRGGNPNHHNNRNHGKMGNNHPGAGNQQNRRNLNQQRYNNLMEDKAAFLEYVRNQERNQR